MLPIEAPYWGDHPQNFKPLQADEDLREVDDEATSLSLHNKKQTKNLGVKQFAKNILLSLGV